MQWLSRTTNNKKQPLIEVTGEEGSLLEITVSPGFYSAVLRFLLSASLSLFCFVKHSTTDTDAILPEAES